MKQGLQFDFEWLASGPIDASERAGLAALSILVNGRSATELEDVFAKTVRGAARLLTFNMKKEMGNECVKERPDTALSAFRTAVRLRGNDDLMNYLG